MVYLLNDNKCAAEKRWDKQDGNVSSRRYI